MDWLNKLFEIDKLPFKIVFLIAIISGVVSFAPEEWLLKLQLQTFRDEYGMYIGVTFLFSAGLAATNICISSFGKLREIYLKAKWKSRLVEKLETLDHSERSVLREFYIQGKHTTDLPINDSTVVGLINKGIIRRAGSYGEHSLSGILFPCVIATEAQKRITKEMIGLPISEPNEEELQRLRDSRPSFVKDIERRNWLRNI